MLFVVMLFVLKLFVELVLDIRTAMMRLVRHLPKTPHPAGWQRFRANDFNPQILAVGQGVLRVAGWW